MLRASHLSSPTVANRVKRCNNGLPDGTSAINRLVGLLAAGRVYLVTVSPLLPVGSYPTRFILTTHNCEAVSFLWHFP